MRVFIILTLTLISYHANAQSQDARENRYEITKDLSREYKLLFKKEIIKVTITENVLSIKNNEGLLLGSFALDSLGVKDSTFQEATVLSNKSFAFRNKNYESKSKINITKGKLDSLTLSINDDFIFAIDGARGWHCINRNHNPVHTCPTLPSLANPSCGKSDCIWQQDQ